MVETLQVLFIERTRPILTTSKQLRGKTADTYTYPAFQGKTEKKRYTCQLSVRASHSRIYIFDNAAATRDRSPLISFSPRPLLRKSIKATAFGWQTRETFYGNPHIFSSTKYLVSKPAPGPTSWNTASLDTPTPTIDRSLHEMKYMYTYFVFNRILDCVKQPCNARGRKSLALRVGLS